MLLGTFISDLILQVSVYAAETEGIEIAKAKGKHLDRPRAMSPDGFDHVYKRWKERQATAKKAMQEFNLKPTTFYKLVGQHEGRI